jgi:hypothetical protein
MVLLWAEKAAGRPEGLPCIANLKLGKEEQSIEHAAGRIKTRPLLLLARSRSFKERRSFKFKFCCTRDIGRENTVELEVHIIALPSTWF